MPGDIGLVAKLLSEALDVYVNPTKYEEWSRERKLKWLMRGVNDTLENNDRATHDSLLAEYRELHAQTGP